MSRLTPGRRSTEEELEALAEDRANDVDPDQADWLAGDAEDQIYRD